MKIPKIRNINVKLIEIKRIFVHIFKNHADVDKNISSMSKYTRV